MSSSNLVRLGGLAAVVSGVLLFGNVLFFVTLGTDEPISDNLGLWFLYHQQLTIGLLCGAVGLLGLRARLGEHSGELGKDGASMSYIAIALSVIEALTLCVGLFLGRPIAGVTAFVGWLSVLMLLLALVLLGVATVRTNVLPRWGSVLPLLIGALFLLTFVVEIVGEGRNVLSLLLDVLVALAWVALGYALLTTAGGGAADERSTRVV